MNATSHIDGQQLRGMFEAGARWVDTHRLQVNALNIFPVPDGDTGTNMALTLKAALQNITSEIDNHAGRVAAGIAQGALLGARGNSGVILSQLLHGFSVATHPHSTLTTQDFSAGFKLAYQQAYQAVANPVEGTILSVAAHIARLSEELATQTSSLESYLHGLLAEARQALDRTPEQLPQLKQAGVVDSGGQGFVYLLEGMLHYLDGQHSVDLDAVVPATTAPTRLLPITSPARHGYDVQFLIRGHALDLNSIRQAIYPMGDSVLVVGTPDTIKVHVHTPDPGPPLSYGAGLGQLDDIVVENMDLQQQAFQQSFPAASIPGLPLQVFALAFGAGQAEIFQSLGVVPLLFPESDQTFTVQDIVVAIETHQPEEAILLPNHRHAQGIAQQASRQSTCPIYVVPSSTLPQGINAALRFDPEQNVSDNLSQMNAGLDMVHTITLTHASSAAQSNQLSIPPNHFVAFHNNNLVHHGPNIVKTLIELLHMLPVSGFELLSIYTGQASQAPEISALQTQITQTFPHLTLETLPGGQCDAHYIISLE